MDAGTLIVMKSGQGQFTGVRAAAWFPHGFEHLHPISRTRDFDRSRQTIGAGSNDDRVPRFCHVPSPTPVQPAA